MRYVLLKHEKNGDFHVDFLLDCGVERLLSWQIEAENFTGAILSGVNFFHLAESPKQITDAIDTVCRRIFDHRKRYLDYEGEITENRGQVTRVEYGTWEILVIRRDCIVLQTSGRHIAEDATTVKQWQFRPPEGFAIATQALTPQDLLQTLPPPGEAIWHLQCRFL